MELNRRDFYGRLEDIVQGDNMRILKVKDQNVGIKRDSEQVYAVFVRLEVLNQRDGYQVLLRWVEPDARDSLGLTVLLFEVGPRHNIDVGVLTASRSILVAKHLEIVLEHIDDLVGLKGFLDAVLDAVDELVKLLVEVAR